VGAVGAMLGEYVVKDDGVSDGEYVGFEEGLYVALYGAVGAVLGEYVVKDEGVPDGEYVGSAEGEYNTSCAFTNS
tara:strand:+ start:3406 stop:3630 length:225 start_codon:yes stop_codon:yes gene_type:complete